MDSESGRHRRRRPKGGSRGRVRPGKKTSPSASAGRAAAVPVSSSFARVVPSRVPIILENPLPSPMIGRLYIGALFVLAAFVAWGGRYPVLAASLALVLPGLALLLRPPSQSPGRWIDWAALGFLVCGLFAFLPQFYWKTAPWRRVAVEELALELPGVLSIQPGISLEAFLWVLSGVAWFYAVASWPLNHRGRKAFYVTLSCLLAAIAGWRIFLTLSVGGDAGAFSKENDWMPFLAMGGVVSFGFAMEGIQGRKLLHLSGLLATTLCAVALTLDGSASGTFLYLLGVLLWLTFRLRSAAVPLLLKVAIVVVVGAFGFFLMNPGMSTDAASGRAESAGSIRVGDTVRMIADAPLTGVGLGNFSAIAPQYRSGRPAELPADGAGSDLLWLIAEVGLVGFTFLLLFFAAYFRRAARCGEGHSGVYRMTALVVVILVVLQGLVDTPWHRPGVAHLALLFVAFALPAARGGARTTFKPAFWRVSGLVLLLIGGAWFLAAVFGAPTHSSVRVAKGERDYREKFSVADYEGARAALDRLIGIEPFAWRHYSDRARVTLLETGDRNEAELDFQRARFVEPHRSEVTFEEGLAWQRLEPGRAITAWENALERAGEEKGAVFAEMLNAARDRRELMRRLSDLSKGAPDLRTQLIVSMQGADLMEEIRQDLRRDPALGQYTAPQRAAILERWLEQGDLEAAESFLESHAKAVGASWRSWALLRKNQARFAEAVAHYREALPVAAIPEYEIEAANLSSAERSFFFASQDSLKGAGLLRYHIERENLERALEVASALVGITDPPEFAFYWRAELLYRLEDYVESCYAFEAYVDRVEP